MPTSKSKSNAHNLLLEYRATLWRKAALESVQGTGRKALQACKERLRLTQELVAVLRNNKLLGEKLYWIVFVTYMTDRQPCDIDEILSDIAIKHMPIPRRTYFRLRGRAIQMLDNHLNDIRVTSMNYAH